MKLLVLLIREHMVLALSNDGEKESPEKTEQVL